jgi:probable HAF family extracellular repeat protein
VATDIQGRAEESYAYSINDLGHIIGASQLGGTVWNNGVATALESLSGFFSWGVSINNLGQIVGSSSNLANGKNRATLWNHGVAIDLNSFLNASEQTAGWVLLNGTDINDNGSIVGFAINTVSGVQRGFLLQSVAAVPEADTSAMLLLGASVMGFMVRRRQNTQV